MLIRKLICKINNILGIYDCDDKEYEALKQRQQWVDKCDISKYFTIIPVWSTASVQRKDGSPLTHGTLVGHGSKNTITDPTRYMSIRKATSLPEQSTM